MYAQRVSSLLLFSSAFLLPLHSQQSTQTPVQRYQAAKHTFELHSEGDFLHDDSPAAIKSLESMWSASADAVIQLLSQKPGATAKDIDAALCNLESSNDCGKDDGARQDALSLGPHLFLVSQFSSEAGTVFVVGMRDGKPTLLWSINTTEAQERDRRDWIGAWKADRAGGACRANGSGHKPGSCGPLYASLGLLPPDADGKPRFYIDAGYAQIMGATVGKQTSVWRWDGYKPELLWIDWHDFMIDQKDGTQFVDGVLSIGEKDEFRTFYGCGSCEARQMLRRLKITSNNVEDLGKVSTTPELDLVDELFWRLANDRLTADIASPQVSQLLKPQILAAKLESEKITPQFFTIGMLGDVFVNRTDNNEYLCFTVDGDIGQLYFILQNLPNKGAKLTDVKQAKDDYGDCPKTFPKQ